MKVQLQLIAATIGLTILIWAFADQQGQKTVDFFVAVRISTQPNVVPKIENPPAQAPNRNLVFIKVAAKGPNALIRELDLRSGSAFEVSIPVTENLDTTEPRVIEIGDAVADATRDHRLQFVSATPPAITVRFDRREHKKLQIVADPGTFREAISGDIQIEPEVVDATLLASELLGLTDREDARLVIPIEQQLRERASEEQFDLVMPLEEIKWQGLTPSYQPRQVRISGRIKSLHVPLELTLIPLRVMYPMSWPSDEYKLVLEDDLDKTLPKVEVLVPVGKPRMPTNTDVKAFIEVDGTMLPPETTANGGAEAPATEPSPHIQKVRFVFDEEFKDVRVVSTPPMIKFRIVKRSTIPPTGTETPPP